MSFTLYDATLDDATLVTTLIHQAFEEYKDTLTPSSGAHIETVETITAKMQKGGAILARIDEVWAGCVLYYPDAEKGADVSGAIGDSACLSAARHCTGPFIGGGGQSTGGKSAGPVVGRACGIGGQSTVV